MREQVPPLLAKGMAKKASEVTRLPVTVVVLQ